MRTRPCGPSVFLLLAIGCMASDQLPPEGASASPVPPSQPAPAPRQGAQQAQAAPPQPQAAPPQGGSQQAQAAPASPDGWPRTSKTPQATFTMYPPQLDSWDGGAIQFRTAASVQPADENAPARFGVLEFQARTLTDTMARVVELRDLRIVKATFPSASAEETASYLEGFRKGLLPSKSPVIALDRLEAQLAIAGAQRKAREQRVRNDPPRIVFSEQPAALVLVDGKPAWREVQSSTLERVINTRALLARQRGASEVFLHLLDGWVSAPSLQGPWTVRKDVPAGLNALAEEAASSGTVDLLSGAEDPATKRRPSLQDGVPRVVVAQEPTEVITFDGQPNWVPLQGTTLLYVENTTANVFRSTEGQRIHVLISGRWFASASLDGPWTFVPGKDLPSDFAKIPDSSPKENVKASIPGTRQAKEAAIAAEVPQTAVVYPDKVQFKPQPSGAPVVEPIEGTGLSYVANSPDPVIQVPSSGWFAVQNGVWFTAHAFDGPWKVATKVPAEIYAIPVSSPVHYVTYVRVYTVSPTYVVVGYTSGYMGAVVTTGDVVVYGTGYAYPAYVGGSAWYPWPLTYGYSVGITFTPWTGWTFGFMAVGGPWFAAAPYWGAYRYPYAYGGFHHPYGGAAYGARGAAAWGAGGWAATSGDVYRQWGSTAAVTRNSAGYNAWTGNARYSQAGRSYNSTNGRVSAGQRTSVQNAYTGGYASGARGATYNPTTGVGAAGSVATAGNARTGSQVSAGSGVVTGPGGQATSVAGATGERGSVARAGGDYYATRDGNVYRSAGSGGFEQVTPGGSGASPSSSQSASLEQQQAARSLGQQRASSGGMGAAAGRAGRGGGGRGR